MTGNSAPIHRRIKGILFDLDNTLFDRDLAFRKWAYSFVQQRFPEDGAEARAEILQKIVAIDAHGYVTKQVLFTEIKALYPAITEEVEALCDRFYQDWLMHMRLDIETVELLDSLELAGVPFGIITNGPAQQHLKIRQLGLQHRVNCLFVSAEFGCNKPDPAIFKAAASCLGVSCSDLLFVGDNPHADICGAHAVGMQTAWLPCGVKWPETIAEVKPDYVLASLSELKQILAMNTF